MHGLKAELHEIAAIAAVAARGPPHVDILICPPTSLLADATRTASGRICIGGRTVSPRSVRRSYRRTSAKRCLKTLERALSSSDIRRGASITARPTPSSPARVWPQGGRGLLAILCVGETQQLRRLRPRRDRAGTRCVERRTPHGRSRSQLGDFRAACSSP